MDDLLIQNGITEALQLSENRSEGPLSGLRVAVKDLFDIAGTLTRAGNPDWARTHPVALQTAQVVQTLLNAGACVVGKALTDELAYSLNGQNVHYGTPLNHAALLRLPGGSSSGSAVAVASGYADLGLGTDTGGSIRVPASYNGLFGLRPSHGVLTEPLMVALAPSFDTIGWMSRDLATLMGVAEVLLTDHLPIERPSCINKLLILKPRIAAQTIWSEQVDALLEPLKPHFAEIKEIRLPEGFFRQASETFRTLQGAEIWQTHGDWIEQHQPHFAEEIAERFTWCKALRNEAIMAAQMQRQVLRRQMDAQFGSDSAILMPTTPGAAPLLTAQGEWMKTYRTQLMGLSALAGLTQRPQISLPLLQDQDAPWGLSLIGSHRHDFALLQLAQKLLTLWKVQR